MWTKEIDRRLIILKVLYELFQNNQTLEIRRARLKEACDDRLNKETNGAHADYGGGSFEWCLEDLEKQGLIRIVREKNKTTIISNINRIEFFLQREELGTSFHKADKTVIESNIEDSILEEIIEEVYGKILDRTVETKYGLRPKESYYEIRKFIAKTMANMMSRAFDINISFDPSKMQLSKDSIKAVVTPIFGMVEHNVGSPFNITINYKGISLPSMEILPRYEPAINQSFKDCFIKWVKSAYDFTINEEVKVMLRKGEEHLLPEPLSEYYRIFCSSVSQYLVLLLSKGHLAYESM